MIDPDLTKGFSVKTLADGHYYPFPLRSNELILHKLQYATNVLCSLIRNQVNNHFDVLFASIVFDGDFLVEYELVGRG